MLRRNRMPTPPSRTLLLPVLLLGLVASSNVIDTPRERARARTAPGATNLTAVRHRSNDPGQRRFPRFPMGDVRIADIRSLGRSPHPREPVAMSSDGALVAYRQVFGERTWLGVLDLTTLDRRRVAPVPEYPLTRPAFSPDGRRLAYRRGHSLWVFDSGADTRRVVARHVGVVAPIAWVADGRIAYVDVRRRLQFLVPGGIPHDSGFRFPRPSGIHLRTSMAVSPDGSRVLVSDGCDARLVDLATGRRRTLPRHPLGVPNGAWSPDGSHFVLDTMSFPTKLCSFSGGPGWIDLLYDANGHELGSPLGLRGQQTHGHVISWSTDGDWLFVSNNPTGTGTTGLTSLSVVDVPRLQTTYLINSRLVDATFMGPGGWMVFSKYRFDTLAVADRGRESATLKLGRLIPRAPTAMD
jgi:WD40-like Beta Propeller Repeat